MKKSILQITGIASIFVVATIFGVVASNIDNSMPIGSAALANLDLEDQIDKVDHAIIGIVKEAGKPYPDKNAHPDIPRYFGDVIVTVEEDLYGTISEKEITIRTHANMKQAPTFEQGERVLLFLIPGHPDSVEGEGVYVVSGMYQGKYAIKDGIAQDPKHEELIYNVNNLKSQIIQSRG